MEFVSPAKTSVKYQKGSAVIRTAKQKGEAKLSLKVIAFKPLVHSFCKIVGGEGWMAGECKGLETEVVIKVKGAKAPKYR